MEKPVFIDLSAASSRSSSAAGLHPPGARSTPRVRHYDGDIPPVLSPLDAFAAQSRKLAKELEAAKSSGQRRVSRLPPSVISNSLLYHQANRPAVFRSLSADVDEDVASSEIQTSTANTLITIPDQRPMSSYPIIGSAPQLTQEDQDSDEAEDRLFIQEPRSFDFLYHKPDYFDPVRTSSLGNTEQNHKYDHADGPLPPPNAAFARSHRESSDDEWTSSNGGSTFSIAQRKTSLGSGMSVPCSPALASHARTPSTMSETSLSSQHKARLTYNFSRPLSPAGLPTKGSVRSTTTRGRQQSVRSNDNTPKMSSEEITQVRSSTTFQPREGSFTHRKFFLPKGNPLEKPNLRTSQIFAGLSSPTLEWKGSIFPATSPSLTIKSTSSEPTNPTSNPSRSTPVSPRVQDSKFSFDFTESRPSRISEDSPARPLSARTLPELDRQSTNLNQRSSRLRLPPGTSSHLPGMPTLPPIPGSVADYESIKSVTSASASTVRPSTARTYTESQSLSAEEHVEKAIQLHQDNNLQESTYHFRIAAKQKHPTGMLLYALATRHGWGMRPNPTEGVRLLRLAIDAAIDAATHDLADDDIVDRPLHKAQFALALYELGISHLKGIGVEPDKPLALRCFEVAGSWGDVDALTEAAFCYTEGIGTKKDVKRAAKLYRAAAARGASMVGHSWIWKAKYDDDGEDERRRSTAHKRDKSRTRSYFGRRRGNTLTTTAASVSLVA